jgi:D-tyrosyl-tRNA(Tyr) deacylase
MRAIVQRVSMASVRVDGREVGRCGRGLLLLVGVHKEDTPAQAEKLADKVAGLRIFNDAEGKMNLAIRDYPLPNAGFELDVLAISNFTVYGDAAKNRRPSFIESAPFELGRTLFDAFVLALRKMDVSVQTGEFGAHMDVSLVNDGPVTLVLDV